MLRPGGRSRDLRWIGFLAAEIVGDSGEAAKFELRYSGLKPTFIAPAYSPYAFVDWGRVQRREQ